MACGCKDFRFSGSKDFIIDGITDQFRFDVHVLQQRFHADVFGISAVFLQFFLEILKCFLRCLQPLLDELVQFGRIVLQSGYRQFTRVKF